MAKIEKNMIPYFVLDQIALGPMKLYTWGLFVGLGFSAGYLGFYYLAKKDGLAPIKIAGLALAIFIGAIAGAWVLARLTAGGGAMFMGGFLGAITCGALYVRLVKLDLWRLADLLVLPTLLGIAIGRIGCILINDHQGAATNLPWGILWPDGITRHPVALYEMLMALGLFAGFCFLFSSPPQLRGRLRGGGVKFVNHHLTSVLSSSEERRKDGWLFLLFLASYSAFRFLLDFTRVSSGPLADPRWGALSVSQWVALLIFGFVVSLYLYRKRFLNDGWL